MLSKLSVAFVGALSLSSTLVSAAPAPHLEKRVALGSPTDGCKVGQLRLGGGCLNINTCIFASTSNFLGLGLDLSGLALLKLDTGKILDLASNTCISTNQCLTVHSGTIVSQTVAGILGVRICQRPTVPTVPTCTGLFVLNKNTGLCECPLGFDSSGSDDKICIKQCSSDKILSNGLCVCAPGRLLNSVTNQCINIDACNTVLNEIVDGVCKPKTCSGTLVINSSGICVCPAGLVLNKITNLCIAINLCTSHTDGVCNILAGVGADLHDTVDKVVDKVENAVGGAVAGVGATLDGAVDKVENTVEGTVAGVGAALEGTVHKVDSVVDGAIAGAGGAVAGAGGVLGGTSGHLSGSVGAAVGVKVLA